jgi:hypothetical protein
VSNPTEEIIDAPKMLRVPVKLKSRAMMVGTLEKLENVEHLVLIVEDDEGVWSMTLDGTTLERMNWMLDRAKKIIHE